MLIVFLSAINVFFFLLTLSLLYLAKSCLHWLRKCVMSPACLRTAELKLIKVWYYTYGIISCVEQPTKITSCQLLMTAIKIHYYKLHFQPIIQVVLHFVQISLCFPYPTFTQFNILFVFFSSDGSPGIFKIVLPQHDTRS